ncbi:LAMI_0D00562g1_1 [Lachancea mirantina]|uniref:U1 small nuclear ribonucleoprotein component SNU71 n=1 Tax=Lachancea mirantina TaxID=1230905 RepID=A0A1G4J8I8_9SACH|nr:LAMI_0D00562g1_1 [Lachancea mirantina]
MDSIVFVSPNVYMSSGSRNLWHSDVLKPGYIPILRSDLLKFRDALDRVQSTLEEEQNSSLYRILDLETQKQQELGNDVKIGSKTDQEERIGREGSKFQEVKAFLPISLEQQLHTLSIIDLPGEHSSFELEGFIKAIERLTEARVGVEDAIVCWSITTGIDTHSIFLRCKAIPQFGFVVKYWRALLSAWHETHNDVCPELRFDENTSRYLEDLSRKDLPQKELPHGEELAQDVEEIQMQLLKNDSVAAKAEDADLVVQYKVDVSTLSDLPRSSLDQLCKDIMYFRTRVLTAEKEKHAKEEQNENRRRRLHLKKVLEQIRKSQGKDETNLDVDDDEEGVSGEEEIEEDEQDDWVVEQAREAKERQESDRRFEKMIQDAETEIMDLAALKKAIGRTRDYEILLRQERGSHLRELMHMAADPYYDHRRSFKADEERRDAEDRALHPEATVPAMDPADEGSSQIPVAAETATTGPVQAPFKIEITKPQKTQAETLVYSEEELEAALNKLRSSKLVEQLVQEFLGESEQDLVDYIFDHISENRSKNALCEELRDTFDDDAVTIADKIWNNL